MSSPQWPQLDYDDWSETIATVHMWTQIAGKIRLELTPWTNHSWHVPLYVTPTGLTSSTIHHGPHSFDLEFDFLDHEFRIRDGAGRRRSASLEPRTVASFYEEVMGHLDDLDLRVDIYEVPSEVEDPIPFSEDVEHSAYDADAASRFTQILNQSVRVFSRFRAQFLGKSSPTHFFWGSFDLASTRFSGRAAPPHPGGIPGLPDWVTREAYSHEVYSCGFWPGGAANPAPAYYAYAYPVPDGLGDFPDLPEGAFWSADMGEFFLPYEAVRTASDPDEVLTSFLDGTYEAVAQLAEWDRGALEVPPGYPRLER